MLNRKKISVAAAFTCALGFTLLTASPAVAASASLSGQSCNITNQYVYIYSTTTYATHHLHQYNGVTHSIDYSGTATLVAHGSTWQKKSEPSETVGADGVIEHAFSGCDIPGTSY